MINFENQKLYNMETIRIQFQPNVKEKIMSFLESLPKKEVEITIEDSQFEKDKAEVQRQYNEFKNGNCKVYSIEEVEEMIENGML